MNLSELMSTTPETLAKQQHEELKKHVLDVLDKVRESILADHYPGVRALTSFSPAGDGMGLDNNFINFDYKNTDYGVDIVEVLDELESLHNIAYTKKEKK
jgi:hypothetical protein